MNHFESIVNPLTNRKVSVNSALGKKIISNYIMTAGNDNIDYYELDQEDFEKAFREEMKKLSENKAGKVRIYEVESFERNHKWFGVDLTKIKIEASSVYDFWLKLDSLFKEQSGKSLFDWQYDLYMELLGEEADDENDDIVYDMKAIIKFLLNEFKTNDTFWYTSYRY
jgi:hypothetical protein